MIDKAKHQIVALLIGENGAGKTWIANRLVTEFGWDAKLSIASLLRDMITDPGVFGLPSKYFSDDLKDKPLDFNVQVQEGHLRRVISWLAERLPPPLRASMRNDIRKVGISSLPRPTIKTPREFLQYVGFGIINKISQFTLGNLDLLPTMAYNMILGVPGRYVFDDLRMNSQLTLAKSRFQFVYPIEIKMDSKSKKKETKGVVVKLPYAEESEWAEIKPFFSIQNSESVEQADAAIKAAVDAMMNDVQASIKRGNVAPLPITANETIRDYVQAKGPLASGMAQPQPTTMKVGKAMFAKAKLDERGQLTDAPIQNEKINLNYTKAKR